MHATSLHTNKNYLTIMFRESPQPEVPKYFYPNIGQSFRLLIRLILITIPLSIPYMIVMALNKEYVLPYGQLLTSFTLLLAYVISFYIVARLGLKRIRKYDTSDYRLKFNMEPYQVLLIVVLMVLSGSILISAMVDLLPESEWLNDIMSELARPNIFSFINVVIAAPLLEEILFRGVILEGLLKNYSPAKAIIWSAVIFAISHLNPWQSTGVFFLGLLLGWVYYKSNSIIPGIVMHFANNLFGYIILIYSSDATEPMSDMFSNRSVIALGTLLVTWRWLNKRWTSPQAEPAL